MSVSVRSVLDRIRRPEYTGENRCTPCTVVNLCIAALVTVVAGAVTVPLGVAVAALSLLSIYLRGYLVPGTPTLTKRYLPDRMLRWFEKTPPTALDTDLDVETQLLTVGAVEPVDDDLRVTDAFETAWRREIDRVRGDTPGYVGALLDLEEPEIDGGTSSCRVLDGGRTVGRWPSTAALVVDVAAVPLLRDRTANWDSLSRVEQGQLLAGLRLFVETCPDCGGPLGFSEERVESCCRTREVVTYDCESCTARILEVER